jgi:ribosome modulation factor
MDAWDMGYRAAEQGQSLDENPFDVFVKEEASQWELWLDGYEAAWAQLRERVA